MDFAIDTTKVLPEDATATPTAPNAPPPPHLPFYDRLQTHVAANVEGVACADYRVDDVKLALSTDQANVKLEQVEITRGPNNVNVDGTYVIPEDFAAWQKQPLVADLSIALPDVTQFAADPQAVALEGGSRRRATSPRKTACTAAGSICKSATCKPRARPSKPPTWSSASKTTAPSSKPAASCSTTRTPSTSPATAGLPRPTRSRLG